MVRRQDVPVHTMVLEIQGRVLDRLLHPVTLGRILDSQLYTDEGMESFRLATLYKGLQDSIWAEFADRRATPQVNSHRRALQRLHLKKLAELTVKDGKAPEDARSQARHTLVVLRDQLRESAKAKNVELETKAHIEDSLARVEQILSASVQRVGF
jgi:hypothetical protein